MIYASRFGESEVEMNALESFLVVKSLIFEFYEIGAISELALTILFFFSYLLIKIEVGQLLSSVYCS